MRKLYRRKYWTNLSWLMDQSNDDRAEVYFYKNKADCLFVTDNKEDHIVKIEVRELR